MSFTILCFNSSSVYTKNETHIVAPMSAMYVIWAKLSNVFITPAARVSYMTCSGWSVHCHTTAFTCFCYEQNYFGVTILAFSPKQSICYNICLLLLPVTNFWLLQLLLATLFNCKAIYMVDAPSHLKCILYLPHVEITLHYIICYT